LVILNWQATCTPKKLTWRNYKKFKTLLEIGYIKLILFYVRIMKILYQVKDKKLCPSVLFLLKTIQKKIYQVSLSFFE